jgi:hypothetical protein
MNFHLSNKKALFINMKKYYECIGENPFDTLPLTFHCEKGMEDPQFAIFLNYYNKCEGIKQQADVKLRVIMGERRVQKREQRRKDREVKKQKEREKAA